MAQRQRGGRQYPVVLPATLRAGISHAVKEGIAVFDKDMFRNVNTKVSLDTTGNENACLSRETLLKIANLDLSKSENLDRRDMFMFGFYCRGMELTDILLSRRES